MLSKPHRVTKVGLLKVPAPSGPFKERPSRQAPTGIQLVPDLWLQTGQHTQHACKNVHAVSMPAPVPQSPHFLKCRTCHSAHKMTGSCTAASMGCKAVNAGHNLAFHTINSMKASLGRQGKLPAVNTAQRTCQQIAASRKVLQLGNLPVVS